MNVSRFVKFVCKKKKHEYRLCVHKVNAIAVFFYSFLAKQKQKCRSQIEPLASGLSRFVLMLVCFFVTANIEQRYIAFSIAHIQSHT